MDIKAGFIPHAKLKCGLVVCAFTSTNIASAVCNLWFIARNTMTAKPVEVYSIRIYHGLVCG